MREQRVRRTVAADGHGCDRRGDAHLVERARLNRRHVAADALLQQQLRRLDSGLRVEAFDHSIAQQRVGERHERHPLVVGHVRRDDHAVAAGHRTARWHQARDACSRSRRRSRTRPSTPDRGEPAQVGGARRGIDHDGQRGRVRRDDHFIAQAAFQPEPRDAERLVLVGAVPIDDVVGGLGDAPGHAARGGVVHLPAHDQPTRFVEQRVRGGPHDQQRHEVLEQRRAPREQHGCSPHARHRPPEVEPVHLRHVALGDREEAGQPGFGRQQIVVGRIQPARAVGIRQAVADREQLPLWDRTGSGSSWRRRARSRASRASARGPGARRTASGGRPPGCRCPRWRRRRAAAAPASACRTSSAGGLRIVRAPRWS